MASLPILTGIGSLPAGKGTPEELLRAAVRMQQRFGFGLFTDGEPRGDMLALYAQLPGLGMRNGVPRILGRIRPMEDPSQFPKVLDLEFLKREFPGLGFKMTLTAPTTFLLACAATGAGPAYRSALDPVLHEDLTEALRPIARELARRGAHLQIDDPILSQGMRDYGPALRRLDRIAAEAPRDRVSLHVCGGLARSKALDALLQVESISTLSLALAGRAERENLPLLDVEGWEEHDLFLGAGCIDVQVSRDADVMEPQVVASLLGQIRERVGVSRLRYVLPDCGLRGTSPDLVPILLEKLRRGYELAFEEQS